MASANWRFPSAEEWKQIIKTVDKAVKVGDKALHFLSKLKSGIENMTKGTAMIINASGKGVETFHVYNALTVLRLSAFAKFPSKHGYYTEVYSVGVDDKMTLYVNNKKPGWPLTAGKLYIYDGERFNLVLSTHQLLNININGQDNSVRAMSFDI